MPEAIEAGDEERAATIAGAHRLAGGPNVDGLAAMERESAPGTSLGPGARSLPA